MSPTVRAALVLERAQSARDSALADLIAAAAGVAALRPLVEEYHAAHDAEIRAASALRDVELERLCA